jgi:hypothetical protein
MKRTTLISALFATAFVAGAGVGTAVAQDKGKHFDPHNPKVVVVGKYVVVDQEPIVIEKGDKRTDITWELPPAPSPYRFKDDGIAIDADQFLGCRVVAGGFKYACTDKAGRTTRKYPYRITIYGADGKSMISDASVQNEQ